MIDLAMVCDKLSMLACTLDKHGYFTAVSETFITTLGYRERDVLGKHFSGFISSQDSERSMEAWHSLLNGRPVRGFRNYFITVDGKLRCIEWDATFRQDEAACYCTGKLITPELVEEGDMAEDELYRRMFMENPSAMFVYEPSTLQFLLTNNAACKQYGYTHEEFSKISVMDILPPHRREHFLRALPTYLSKTTSELEDEHQHKTGKIINIIAHAESIRFRNRDCRLVTAIDITVKKMSEERLRLFETVLTNVTDGVMITGPFVEPGRGPRIVYVNPAFEKQSGYTANELVGNYPDILHGPDINLKSISRMTRALELGEPFIGEMTNYNKQGEKYYVGLNIAPVKSPQGKLINFIGVTRDLTDLKQAELQQKKLVDDLVQSSSDMNQFSYIASHNLRAPLTNIMAVTKLIESGTTPQELQRFVGLIKLSSEQLNETIEDLVNILLIKEVSTNKELVDIERLWDYIVSSNRRKLKTVDANIKTSFEVKWVRFNKAYLANILQELLTNAIKFRKAGVPLLVEIASEGTINGITIDFRDNGMGLDKTFSGDKLFGLYQRFHTGVQGKGLGLFVAKSQVNAMGAYIHVETSPGEGFHVIIDIPSEDVS